MPPLPKRLLPSKLPGRFPSKLNSDRSNTLLIWWSKTTVLSSGWSSLGWASFLLKRQGGDMTRVLGDAHASQGTGERCRQRRHHRAGGFHSQPVWSGGLSPTTKGATHPSCCPEIFCNTTATVRSPGARIAP